MRRGGDLRVTICDLRVVGVGMITIVMGCALLLSGCSRKGSAGERSTVTVYTSQDQVFSEPIFQAFTKQTGIEVKAVYDSEAVKTVGLVNRLLAEQNNPQCDVFWNNEELRTRQLAAKGMFRQTNGWAAFGHRWRRLVINTNKLSQAQAPGSWLDLTNAAWRGKVALAYPLFGTTATHFLALREDLGPEGWEHWCRALAANKPFLVDGNSVVVKMVGRGEAVIGMTDSDDIAAGQREGMPVAALPLASKSLLIPNTVGMIRGAPHPETAQQLYDYLQGAEVLKRLRASHAIEPEMADDHRPAGYLQLTDGVIDDMDQATAKLKEIFLR